jgi:hypothetical protein
MRLFLAFADSRPGYRLTASLISTKLKKHHERWRISQLLGAGRSWQHGATLKEGDVHVVFRASARRAL